jgi:hypothetical protein
MNCTWRAREVGATSFSSAASGKPRHGTTIDQPSTQRSR